MSWNYSGNPASSILDKYRFIVGDTIQEQPIMQDEEIQFIIETYKSNENAILYNLFLRVAILFARDIKRTLGPQSEDPTERAKFFSQQISYYRKKCASAGLSIPVYAHAKVFHIGMHSNPPTDGGAYDV